MFVYICTSIMSNSGHMTSYRLVQCNSDLILTFYANSGLLMHKSGLLIMNYRIKKIRWHKKMIFKKNSLLPLAKLAQRHTLPVKMSKI